MIERGQIDGIREKIAIFHATDMLTEQEYIELMGMLPQAE
jgi:hypothetical protein